MPSRNFNIFDSSQVANAIRSTIENELPGKIQSVANSIISDVFQFWASEAIGASPFGQKYASLLKTEYLNEHTSEGRVYLDESDKSKTLFISLMEEGGKSWSIKDALLAGKVARRNKAKYGTTFVRVPFRWKTPKSASSGKTMSHFTSIMPQRIHDIAKAGNTVTLDQAIENGDRNMAGLKKMKTGSAGGHSQYLTFRTVSEKTQGWIHPGYKATPVFEKVEAYVQNAIKIALSTFIETYIEVIKNRGANV